MLLLTFCYRILKLFFCDSEDWDARILFGGEGSQFCIQNVVYGDPFCKLSDYENEASFVMKVWLFDVFMVLQEKCAYMVLFTNTLNIDFSLKIGLYGKVLNAVVYTLFCTYQLI